MREMIEDQRRRYRPVMRPENISALGKPPAPSCAVTQYGTIIALSASGKE